MQAGAGRWPIFSKTRWVPTASSSSSTRRRIRRSCARCSSAWAFAAVARHRSQERHAVPPGRRQLHRQCGARTASGSASRASTGRRPAPWRSASRTRRRPSGARSSSAPTPVANPVGPMELNIPAIEGIGGSVIYLVDRYGERTIYDVDFVPRRRNVLPACRPAHADRPPDAQRASRQHGPVGRVLRAAVQLPRDPLLRHRRRKTGLLSRAMTSPCGKIRIPINESARRQVADRGVSARVSRRGHPAHRAGHRRHLRHGRDQLRRTASTFQDTPDTYYERVDKRLPGHGEVAGAAARRPHPDRRRAKDGHPAADLHAERDRPDLLRDHPAQGQRGLRRGQFPALFESIELDQIGAECLKATRSSSYEQELNDTPRVEGEGTRRGRRMPICPRARTSARSGKEGFFGPAAHIYHRHPPTGWIELRRAAPAARVRSGDSCDVSRRRAVVRRATVLANAHCRMRVLAARGRHGRSWRATPTAMSCCSSMKARASCSATSAISSYRDGDYVSLPRGTMWRSTARHRRWSRC